MDDNKFKKKYNDFVVNRFSRSVEVTKMISESLNVTYEQARMIYYTICPNIRELSESNETAEQLFNRIYPKAFKMVQLLENDLKNQ